jgi:hypothetical protein
MRDPLPEARCCMTSLARGTEYSDERHGFNGDALEVLTEHRSTRRRPVRRSLRRPLPAGVLMKPDLDDRHEQPIDHLLFIAATTVTSDATGQPG